MSEEKGKEAREEEDVVQAKDEDTGEKIKVEESKGTGEEVIKAGNAAIAQANALLSNFDQIYADPDKRRKITVSSGIVVGGALADLKLAADANDDGEAMDRMARGTTTLMEIFFGITTGFASRKASSKRYRRV